VAFSSTSQLQHSKHARSRIMHHAPLPFTPVCCTGCFAGQLGPRARLP
jgi:hypothetical protein